MEERGHPKPETMILNARTYGIDYRCQFSKFISSIPFIRGVSKRELVIKFLYWSNENRNEMPNFAKVHKIFDASYATYARAVEHYKTKKDKSIHFKQGQPPKMPDSLVTDLISWVMKKQEEKILPSRTDITKKANKLLSQSGCKKSVSSKWIDSFLKSENCPFKQSLASPIEEERYEIDIALIHEWFNILASVAATEVHPDLLINLDETGFGKQKKSTKTKTVIVTKDVDDSNLLYAESKDPGHVTVVSAITAGGKMLKPLFIHKNKTLHPDAGQCTFYKNVYYSHTSSSFISTAIYNKYIVDEVIPYVQKIRENLNSPEANAILIVDGHRSHNNEYINAALAEHNIEYLIMPAHSSHILQPLDRYFFHAAKQAYERSKKRTDIDEVTANLERIYIAIQTAAIQANIIRSWSHAGIVPVIEDGEIKRVIFEESKLYKFTSSLFNKDMDLNAIEKDEQNEIKSRKRISEKNLAWGYINEEHIESISHGVCPFCRNTIPSESASPTK